MQVQEELICSVASTAASAFSAQFALCRLPLRRLARGGQFKIAASWSIDVTVDDEKQGCAKRDSTV